MNTHVPPTKIRFNWLKVRPGYVDSVWFFFSFTMIQFTKHKIMLYKMTNSNLPNTITSFSVIIHSKIQVIDTPIQTFCPHSTFLVDITLDILASTIRKGKYRLERKVIKLQRHYCRKSQRNNKNKNWTVTIARLQDIRLTYKSPLLSRILTMNDWNLKSINSKKAHISPLELKLELGWRKEDGAG